MKSAKLKFFIYCLILFCVVFLPITNPVFFDKNYKDKVTYFFCTNKVDNNMISANVIDNGSGCIVVCEYEHCKSIKSILPVVYGESIRITNYSSSTLNYVLNKYMDSVVKTEQIDDFYFIYSFDVTLPRYVTLDGHKVNIQVAISKSEINIGYPLILNGY